MENMELPSVLGRIRINEKEMTLLNIRSSRMADLTKPPLGFLREEQREGNPSSV